MLRDGVVQSASLQVDVDELRAEVQRKEHCDVVELVVFAVLLPMCMSL